MRLIESVAALQQSVVVDGVVGLVPTMGSLHKGHLSLIECCRRECQLVVVSLFVNPLQFGPQEDFERYPRALAADLALCEAAGVDLVFAPTAAEMLPGDWSDRTQVVPPARLLGHLCAPFRPGHFAGVLTIVLQLLQLVRPQRAYFGQKDAQQLVLIERMARDLHLNVAIVACPTVRDPDGLALSSRNQYLSISERAAALGIPRALLQGKTLFFAGERAAERILATARAVIDADPRLRLQYLELVDPTTLQPLSIVDRPGLLAIAAFVGKTRLIDSMLLIPDAESESRRLPLIAIDGPAGAGKSTVARGVAAELGLLYLDTGAMYRAITWLALAQGIPVDDEARLSELAATATLRLDNAPTPGAPTRVWLDDQDITTQIRLPEVTEQVSAVSAHAGVRQALVRQQRWLGRKGGAVLEGRDIGTHVFPEAELKIFLTASVAERARRRQADYQSQGIPTSSLAELEAQIAARDRYDSERPIAPLQRAPDAIIIDSDTLTPPQVQAQIVQLYRQLLAHPS